MTIRRLVAASTIALLGVSVLAACSSSSSSTSTSSSASAVASSAAASAAPASSAAASAAPASSAAASAAPASSAAASAAPASSAAASAAPSGSAGMLPPVIITPGQTTATAKVGDNLDIVVKKPAGTTVDTDKPDLLQMTQAHQDGSAIFNPGGKALKAGTATIIVTNPDGTTRNIVVTITDK